MSFTMEIYELLIRYAKDYKGKTVTVKDLQYEPWWKCVWGHWRAQAYYKMNNYYEKLEDVPEGLENYTIMTDELMTQHFIFNGYPTVQTISKELCKSIYGSVI